MKGWPMPISSPSRAESFPPPLMMLARSNTWSRSRGRSRSSPMFYPRGKRSAAGAAEAAREPSSPKVTCTGQVRATRGASESPSRRRPRRLLCWNLSSSLHRQKGAFRRIFCKWGLLLRSGYCNRVDATEDSGRANPNQETGERPENVVDGNDKNSKFYSKKHENLEIKREFLDDSPRSAVVLKRCKSVPDRASSMGGRFWGSSCAETEVTGETKTDSKSGELQKPICENGIRVSQESSNSVNCGEELKGIGGSGGVHPLLLTRCKSEPARRRERLNLEDNLWMQTSLGAAVETSLQHNC